MTSSYANLNTNTRTNLDEKYEQDKSITQLQLGDVRLCRRHTVNAMGGPITYVTANIALFNLDRD